MDKIISHGAMGLAVLLGGGSLVAFVGFTFWGSFEMVNISSSNQGALMVDTFLSFVFFLQHSLMIRKPFQNKMKRIIPEDYYGAFFAIISGLTLTMVILLWQQTDAPFIEAEGILYWTSRFLFFTAILGFHWGSKALGGFDPFGIRTILKNHGSDKPNFLQFKVKGPYRWVRHPMYTFTLILIWSHPHLTMDRLLFNFLWTAWIVAGTIFEERDLVVTFGDDYKDYQRKVPMLVPFKKPL